jgi:hypothetical protein
MSYVGFLRNIDCLLDLVIIQCFLKEGESEKAERNTPGLMFQLCFDIY